MSYPVPVTGLVVSRAQLKTGWNHDLSEPWLDYRKLGQCRVNNSCFVFSYLP